MSTRYTTARGNNWCCCSLSLMVSLIKPRLNWRTGPPHPRYRIPEQNPYLPDLGIASTSRLTRTPTADDAGRRRRSGRCDGPLQADCTGDRGSWPKLKTAHPHEYGRRNRRYLRRTGLCAGAGQGLFCLARSSAMAHIYEQMQGRAMRADSTTAGLTGQSSV